MKTYYEEIEEEGKDFVEENEEEIKKVIEENKDEEEDVIFDRVLNNNEDKLTLEEKIHEWLDTIWHSFLRRDFADESNTILGSAVKILEESNNRETDNGLWEGHKPEEAIKTQAFYTAKADLTFEIEDRIKKMIKEW